MPLVSKAFGDIITFTRASTATYFDSTGTLQSAAIDVPRLDYSPSTLAAQGLLIEEQRTNSIRNNTMQGAVAGTPGTLPTNWSRSASPTNGISSEIISVGTQAGVTYVDIRFYGTATATSVFVVNFEASNQISAAPSQSCTGSLWSRIISGSIPSQFNTTIQEFDSGNNFLRSSDVAQTVTTTWQRFTQTVTTGASCAFVRPVAFINYSNGAVVDVTLRIGLPQLEQGAFATSVIPTTTTALTRSADVASVNTLSPWFNSAAGTLYAESQQIAVQTGLTFPRSAQIDDGSNNNLITTIWKTDTNRLYGAVTTGGVNQADVGTSGLTQTNTNKIALAYATNDFAASVNGGSASTDTSGTVPTGLTTLRLGSAFFSATLNGYLRRIVYYPRRLSNAELQSITS